MARPKIKIDEKKLKLLAEVGCTYKEMAASLGCSVDTLERRFADKIELARGDGKTKLRRAQWLKGVGGKVKCPHCNKTVETLNGSERMQMHLGKHHLGQHDRVEVSGPDGGPIQFILPPSTDDNGNRTDKND